MDKYAKAIAAGVGGAGVATTAMPFMPEDTPWWGYLVAYAVSIGLPAVVTYLSRENAR